MCGIFGYISRKSLDHPSILASLGRRGPDGKGIEEALMASQERIVFLHTRLSIIDLSTAASQPMWDSTHRYLIVFNGEIYNFLQLRTELDNSGWAFRTRSDTEVILAAYAKWGADCVDRFRGMFAFGIFDALGKSIFLARDPFGMKPLYIYENNSDICFSSTINAVFASGIEDSFRISKKGIAQYLTLGSFCAPDTVLSEVRMLPPGSRAFIRSDRKVIIEKYFKPETSINSSTLSHRDTVQAVKAAVEESVKAHLVADVPVGVFLSGGIDSSVIAAIAARYRPSDLATFTVGFDRAHGVPDETLIAQRTALRIKSRHESVIIGPGDLLSQMDTFSDALDVPSIDGLNSYMISRAIAGRVKAVLSGLGGDEMFAGYPVFRDLFFLKKLKFGDGLIRALPGVLQNALNRSYLKYRGKTPQHILLEKRIVGTGFPNIIEEISETIYVDADVVKTASLFEIKSYMANTLLRDTDAVTLFNGLECRTPFVDKEIFGLSMSIGEDEKVNGKINKPLLVEAFADSLNDEVYSSPKKGFVLPISSWLGQYLAEDKIIAFGRIAEEYNIYPNMCPFKHLRESLRPDTSLLYMWAILLNWIGKNRVRLSAVSG